MSRHSRSPPHTPHGYPAQNRPSLIDGMSAPALQQLRVAIGQSTRCGARRARQKRRRDGTRATREIPLTQDDLYEGTARPPPLKTTRKHQQCSICLNVKSNPVSCVYYSLPFLCLIFLLHQATSADIATAMSASAFTSSTTSIVRHATPSSPQLRSATRTKKPDWPAITRNGETTAASCIPGKGSLGPVLRRSSSSRPRTVLKNPYIFSITGPTYGVRCCVI